MDTKETNSIACGCCCHENKLNKPYAHDTRCCDEMNGYLDSVRAGCVYPSRHKAEATGGQMHPKKTKPQILRIQELQGELLRQDKIEEQEAAKVSDCCGEKIIKDNRCGLVCDKCAKPQEYPKAINITCLSIDCPERTGGVCRHHEAYLKTARDIGFAASEVGLSPKDLAKGSDWKEAVEKMLSEARRKGYEAGMKEHCTVTSHDDIRQQAIADILEKLKEEIKGIVGYKGADTVNLKELFSLISKLLEDWAMSNKPYQPPKA